MAESSWHREYCETRGKNMTLFRNDGLFSDVTITTASSDKVFYCHKVVLASVSPFFETMLCNPMQETLSGRIELELDENTVEDVLQFVYTGCSIVNTDNVYDLYEAANYLQILSLSNQCEQFLRDSPCTSIPKESCVMVWKLASQLDHHDIASMARSTLLKHFSEIYQKEIMQKLGFVDFKGLIADPLLNCKGEIKCKAVNLWLADDFEDRHKYLDGEEGLLRCLVQASVSVKCLEEELAKNEMLNSEQAYHAALARLNTELSIADGTWGIQRPADNFDESLVVIGGEDSGQNTKVMCFSFRQKKWFTMPPVLSDPGFFFAVCGSGSDMYVSGGNKEQTLFLKYDGRSNRWFRNQPMMIGRQKHGMCVIGDKLYVLGGHNSNNKQIKEVSVFGLWTHSWTVSGHIAHPVHSSTIATTSSKIFLLGGKVALDASNAPTSLAQFFDTETNYSGYVPYNFPLKGKSQSLLSVTIDDKIYLITSAVVYEFSEEEKPRKIGVIEKCPKSDFGVSVFSDQILVFGGEDEFYSKQKLMLLYDTRTNRTVPLPEKLPFSLCSFASVRINIYVPHLQDEVA